MIVKQSRAKASRAFPTEEHLHSLVLLAAAVSVAAVFVIVIAGVCSLWQTRNGLALAQRNVPRSLTATEVREQYLAKLSVISEKLGGYLADQSVVSHYSDLRTVRDELVALLVPPDEQTHHLELVLALSRFVDLMEPGAKTSPAEAARARRDLESALTPLAM